jgi:hypothetical protein
MCADRVDHLRRGVGTVGEVIDATEDSHVDAGLALF